MAERTDTPATSTKIVDKEDESEIASRVKLLSRQRKLISFKLKKQCSTHTNENIKRNPLEGVRVLDLSRIVMGPYCTMILGDMGAEVIKVERPIVGDETRRWGVPVNGGQTAYFLAINRNKYSVCIDFKSREGRQALLDLVAVSDVLVENYVPGKLESLDLGYQKIKEVNPSLVYASLTGYGPNGPYASRPGYDVIAASVGGLLHITGPEMGEPCKIGVPMTDIASALYAHGAILAALFNRERTGKGERIDVNLLSTQVACLSTAASAWLNAGEEATRRGSAHDWIVPYEALEARCGARVTVGAGSNAQFAAFCRLLGLQELATNGRYETNALRVANRETLMPVIRRRFKEKTAEEWLEVFEGAPFPYGPVNSVPQVFENPQVKHMKLVKEMVHPIFGTVSVIGPPVSFSDSGNEVRSPPPLLGEHTHKVFSKILKYPEDKIKDLFRIGAIQ